MYCENDPYALDKVTIGELDLPRLIRSYKVLSMYFARDVKDTSGRYRPGTDPLQDKILNWLMDEGPGRLEKDVALRIIFDEFTDDKHGSGMIQNEYSESYKCIWDHINEEKETT